MIMVKNNDDYNYNLQHPKNNDTNHHRNQHHFMVMEMVQGVHPKWTHAHSTAVYRFHH